MSEIDKNLGNYYKVIRCELEDFTLKYLHGYILETNEKVSKDLKHFCADRNIEIKSKFDFKEIKKAVVSRQLSK